MAGDVLFWERIRHTFIVSLNQSEVETEFG